MATPRKKFLDTVSKIRELQKHRVCVTQIPMTVILAVASTIAFGWIHGPIGYILGYIASVIIAIFNGKFIKSIPSFILHDLTTKQQDQLMEIILDATGFQNVDQFNRVHDLDTSLAAIVTSTVVSHMKRQSSKDLGSVRYLEVQIIN